MNWSIVIVFIQTVSFRTLVYEADRICLSIAHSFSTKSENAEVSIDIKV